MQHTVTITIPDNFICQIRELKDLNEFISKAAINALKKIAWNEKKQKLAESAKLMLADYKENNELICFTAIDGDDFHE
ncbi:conserved hypothetical protein [Candidatus Magnetomoraceae bacterium gMMP-15]